ncbi:unnamed protein product [Polarella glacialis]|nr:unnamed protein product [Polarella glacialis]CAE8652040.1 unnamed protein product [Polarella glacialis]
MAGVLQQACSLCRMRGRHFASWYRDMNSSWPITTKSATASSLLAAGDLCTQGIWPQLQCQKQCNELSSPQTLDWARVARMASWGVIAGATGHFWYALLDRLVRQPGARGVVKKILIDQALFTPPYTLAFFMFQNMLSGDGFRASCRAAGDKLLPTLKVNWTYWSLVHVASFTVIPLEYRVLFVSFKNFLWSGFLSLTVYGRTSI